MSFKQLKSVASLLGLVAGIVVSIDKIKTILSKWILEVCKGRKS